LNFLYSFLYISSELLETSRPPQYPFLENQVLKQITQMLHLKNIVTPTETGKILHWLVCCWEPNVHGHDTILPSFTKMHQVYWFLYVITTHLLVYENKSMAQNTTNLDA